MSIEGKSEMGDEKAEPQGRDNIERHARGEKTGNSSYPSVS